MYPTLEKGAFLMKWQSTPDGSTEQSCAKCSQPAVCCVKQAHALLHCSMYAFATKGSHLI